MQGTTHEQPVLFTATCRAKSVCRKIRGIYPQSFVCGAVPPNKTKLYTATSAQHKAPSQLSCSTPHLSACLSPALLPPKIPK
jgi:hypothetical protein